MPTDKQKANLISIREHLKDALEGYRVKLAKLWDDNQTDTALYKKLEYRHSQTLLKLDEVMFKLIPNPKTN